MQSIQGYGPIHGKEPPFLNSYTSNYAMTNSLRDTATSLRTNARFVTAGTHIHIVQDYVRNTKCKETTATTRLDS